MNGALVLDGPATRAALDPAVLTQALRVALVAISQGRTSCPARIAAHAPNGLLGAMPGYVPGLGLAAKLVTVFPTGDGRSSHRGVVVLFDEDTGEVRTVMDAEAITALRTAATATIAMRALARDDRRTVAVIGAGVQARAQLSLLVAEPVPPRIVVGVRRPDRTDLGEFTAQVDVRTIESAVRGADVVLCCTGSRTPVIDRSWLIAGAHVSSVGGSHGPEIDSVTVSEGSLFAEWDGAAASPPPAGAHELQGVPPSRIVLLGAVLDGRHPGRTGPEEITVFKSTGHAALDVAAAHAVDRVVRASAAGETAR